MVSTGGLGPTPDDLTREAIAAACGETPAVDPDLAAGCASCGAGAGMDFPESNLKQAWLLPSATALPNPNGTAPGWFVTRPDGRVIVALPGPPREMRPMWADEVLPRLHRSGLGADVATRTYRLAGIGESQVAERLGEAVLRATNPVVATYARVEAVDVRISAGDDDAGSADDLVERAARAVLEELGEPRLGDRRDDLERRDRSPAGRAGLDARRRSRSGRVAASAPCSAMPAGSVRRDDRARGTGRVGPRPGRRRGRR